MKPTDALLDTHFVLWILTGSSRLERFPWLDRYRPWKLSPVSMLELSFLGEVGRIEIKSPELFDRLAEDPRFLLDDVSSASLFRHGLDACWTRDPFDRLLAAHSTARRLPLVTVDRQILRHHRLLPRELRSAPEAAST